jgi:hypothetical protein
MHKWVCFNYMKNPIRRLGGVALTRYMDGRTPRDGKSSHGLWPGELKKVYKLKISNNWILNSLEIYHPENTTLYIYVWKLNQTVLELDFWAVKFVFFPRRDLNSHHWYTAAPIA